MTKEKIKQNCKDCVFLVECAIKCQELNKTQKEICPIEKSFEEKDKEIERLKEHLSSIANAEGLDITMMGFTKKQEQLINDLLAKRLAQELKQEREKTAKQILEDVKQFSVTLYERLKKKYLGD